MEELMNLLYYVSLFRFYLDIYLKPPASIGKMYAEYNKFIFCPRSFRIKRFMRVLRR